MINILHLCDFRINGTVTFVAQLAKAFDAAKIPCRIIRLAKRSESRLRPLGADPQVSYQNLTFEDAAKLEGKFIMGSSSGDLPLSMKGVDLVQRSKGCFVFHDPHEYQSSAWWRFARDLHKSRVVCVRQQGLSTIPYGRVILHPYTRVYPGLWKPRRRACSLSRVCAIKHSEIIVEANQKLVNKIDLLGDVNRFWWRYTIQKHWPGLPIPQKAPETTSRAELASQYVYMVDLTSIPGDGGGVQYTTLEALDAGTIPVFHRDWTSGPDPTCHRLGPSVTSADELVALLNLSPVMREWFEAAQDQLLAHDPITIARQYADYLEIA